MSNKSVLCIAESRGQAEKIVNGLKHSGFANNDISALFPDQGGTRDFAHAKGTKAPEGAVAGVSGGALVGGALGWLAGVGALVVPGIGPLVAAGPILAALSGVAVGGTVGGITGAVVGMGFPEYEAKRYEGKVLDGNILISVHTDNPKDIRRARNIFEQELAQDIAVAGESEVEEHYTSERHSDDFFYTVR